MAVIPADGVTPWNEPAELPCSNPPECSADEALEIANSWRQWEYKCWSYSTEHPGTIVHVTGYTAAMFRAWNSNPRPQFAHPPPDVEFEMGGMVEIIQHPGTLT